MCTGRKKIIDNYKTILSVRLQGSARTALPLWPLSLSPAVVFVPETVSPARWAHWVPPPRGPSSKPPPRCSGLNAVDQPRNPGPSRISFPLVVLLSRRTRPSSDGTSGPVRAGELPTINSVLLVITSPLHLGEDSNSSSEVDIRLEGDGLSWISWAIRRRSSQTSQRINLLQAAPGLGRDEHAPAADREMRLHAFFRYK